MSDSYPLVFHWCKLNQIFTLNEALREHCIKRNCEICVEQFFLSKISVSDAPYQNDHNHNIYGNYMEKKCIIKISFSFFASLPSGSVLFTLHFITHISSGKLCCYNISKACFAQMNLSRNRPRMCQWKTQLALYRARRFGVRWKLSAICPCYNGKSLDSIVEANAVDRSDLHRSNSELADLSRVWPTFSPRIRANQLNATDSIEIICFGTVASMPWFGVIWILLYLTVQICINNMIF